MNPITGYPDHSSPDSHRAELERLLRRAFDDELEPEEADRLQHRLRDSPADRRLYLEYAALHALLGHTFDAGSELTTLPTDLDRQRSPLGSSRLVESRWRRIGRSRTLVGVAFAAAALTCVVFAWNAGWPARFPPAVQPVVAWRVSGNVANRVEGLRAGDRVQGSAGQADLRFENGVQLSLSPGGNLEIVSESVVRLLAGQIQADVGEFGRGFTVLTESTDVVDLGTVFGVEVHADGPTDVVVFEGEVELSRKGGQNANVPRQQNLNGGEAVRIQSSGERARLPVIWRDSGDSNWSSVPGFSGRSIISSVRDNLATESRPKFYAIVPEGFREDAKVYVDRPYEWNGLDEAGLAPELVGADYIRTFNDDKRSDDLEIVVELRGPAALYVLIDTRYPTPDWLAADFSRTEFRIGIDLGSGYSTERQAVPPLGITVPRWLERGSGNSVDVPVTVWKREVRDVAEVRFGPVPTGVLPTGRGNMYGIVAVPLTTDQ